MNIILLLLIAVPIVLSGCDNPPEKKYDFQPLENGFGFEGHSKETYPMHEAAWAGLVYKQSNNVSVAVWPYVMQVSEIQITNNIAVLVGGVSEIKSDGHEGLTQRLIAFEAPAGPTMDITGDVFKKYCSETSVNLTNIIKDSFATLTKTNNGLLLEFGIIKIGLRVEGSVDAEGASEVVSWDEIRGIMRDVKKNGKVKKEKWSGAEYLQKE